MKNDKFEVLNNKLDLVIKHMLEGFEQNTRDHEHFIARMDRMEQQNTKEHHQFMQAMDGIVKQLNDLNEERYVADARMGRIEKKLAIKN